MKNIKVRVWNRFNNTFCYFDISNPSQADLEGLGIFKNVEKQLFTGLLDKQGKEIYEGDIVKMVLRENIGIFNVPDDIIANHGYTGREDVYAGSVIYQDGYFGIDDKESGCVSFMLGDDTILEVVGNIYENPELLTNPKT